MMEMLESRLVLSTVSTWSGASSDLWSDMGNWDNLPTNGNDLVFPSVTNLTSTNDLPAGMSFGNLSVSAGGYTISGDAVTLTGAVDSSQTTGTNTVSIPIDFSGAGSVTVDTSGAVLALGGVLTGSNGLTKLGAGELDLTAANLYTGATTISDGVLRVDSAQGGSPVTISSGATLGGVGTVGTITSNSGIVAPGNAAPGVLTDVGDLDLGAGSSFNAIINSATVGSGYSQLQVAGQIHLNNATLNATLNYTPTSNDQITLIKNNGSQSVVGTFNNLPQGATVTLSGQTFQISYTGGSGHDVVLTHQLATSVTVVAAPTAAVVGQTVALTATVTAASGTGTPTGTVEFMNGTTDLGVGTLNGNIASLTTTALPLGTDSITAVYQGSSGFAGGTSPTPATVTVTQASTTTTVSASPTSTTINSPVTLTAKVAPISPGSGTPTGTVTFLNGTTTIATATLSGGTATFTAPSLPLGSNSITAKYLGDTNFTASTSTATTVPVGQGVTTTTVSAAPTSSVFGQSVTLTATITGGAGTLMPTGNVTFVSGTTTLGTGTVNGTTATLSTTALPVGTDSVTAIYQGDINFSTSTSAAASETVAQASTTTALTSSASSIAIGGSVTLTATVAPVSPGAGTPTGTITFVAGTTTLGTGTLSGGTATLTTTALPVAVNSITAVYSGDTNFTASTSTAASVTSGSANELFLNQVFLDVVYRPIDAASLRLYGGQLAKGRSRKQVVREIVNTPEAQFDAVQTDFMNDLGFFASPAQVAGAVREARATGKDINAVILSSSASIYALRAQGFATINTYLDTVATAVIGDVLPQTTQNYLAGQIERGTSLLQVAEEVVVSPDGKDAQLTNTYETILGRAPTAAETKRYAGSLNQGNANQRLLITLLSSDEFYTLATTGS